MSTRRSRLEVARSRSPHRQKPRTQTPAYLLFVNRPLGAVLARHAYSVGATPDHLTFTGVAIAVAGLVAVLAAASWPVAGVLGGLLLLVAYAFDSADGQLARLYGGGSAAGEWLDHVVDIAKTAGAHAVVVAVVLQHPATLPGASVAVPLGFLVVSTTSFFSLTLRDQLLPRRDDAAARPPFRLARAFTGLPNDHAALCVVLALAGWPTLFLTAYTGLGVVSALLLGRSLRHSHAVLAAPGATPPFALRAVGALDDVGSAHHPSTREISP